MALFHAVVRIDHPAAQVLQFDTAQVQRKVLKAHTHPTKQHGSAVRTAHAFFGEVCAALAGITDALVAGAHTTQADFRHDVDKHRPAVAAQIKADETVDHPSDNQLVALAQAFFLKYDRMHGVQLPT